MCCKHLRPTRLEIDLDKLKHNFREIRRVTNPHSKICTVLKADGYGMGAYHIAKELLPLGTSYFAVALLNEATDLRQRGIDSPILVLGYTPDEQFEKIVDNNITQTIYSVESAIKLANVARRKNKKAKIHIKLDTGMCRLGFQAKTSSITEIKSIFDLEGLEVEGMYTHFAKADENDVDFTYGQFNKYMIMVDRLEKADYRIPVKHVANSAAIIQYPDTHLDMVRAGISIYGLYPDGVDKTKVNLKPIMCLKTRVSHVKKVEKGIPISYGGTYVTERESVIATLPIGYADGFPKSLSSKGNVLLNGKRAPIVGNICLDQCMIDVTGIENVKTGDEVILIGSSGNKEITVDEIANQAYTIRDEIIANISKRVPRVYLRNNSIVKVINSSMY